jgi:hypothetical protein
MRAITVYRVDFDNKTRYPVGVVLEQRKTDRGKNYKDLLRLARKTFAVDAADSVHIVIDSSQALRSYLPAQTMDCWAG